MAHGTKKSFMRRASVCEKNDPLWTSRIRIYRARVRSRNTRCVISSLSVLLPVGS